MEREFGFPPRESGEGRSQKVKMRHIIPGDTFVGYGVVDHLEPDRRDGKPAIRMVFREDYAQAPTESRVDDDHSWVIYPRDFGRNGDTHDFYDDEDDGGERTPRWQPYCNLDLLIVGDFVPGVGLVEEQDAAGKRVKIGGDWNTYHHHGYFYIWPYGTHTEGEPVVEDEWETFTLPYDREVQPLIEGDIIIARGGDHFTASGCVIDEVLPPDMDGDWPFRYYGADGERRKSWLHVDRKEMTVTFRRKRSRVPATTIEKDEGDLLSEFGL